MLAKVNLKTLAAATLPVVTFVLGVWVGHTYWPTTKTVTVHDTLNQTTEESIPISGTTETKTETIIKYVPKPVKADGTVDQSVADIDMKFGKPDLKVMVNGTEVNVQKASDEKHVFDKGQMKVEQESTATFKVSVDPIDNTKDYGFGMGINKDGQPAAVVTAPVSKKHHIDGWIYGDKDSNFAGGVMFRF